MRSGGCGLFWDLEVHPIVIDICGCAILCFWRFLRSKNQSALPAKSVWAIQKANHAAMQRTLTEYDLWTQKQNQNPQNPQRKGFWSFFKIQSKNSVCTNNNSIITLFNNSNKYKKIYIIHLTGVVLSLQVTAKTPQFYRDHSAFWNEYCYPTA